MLDALSRALFGDALSRANVEDAKKEEKTKKESLRV